MKRFLIRAGIYIVSLILMLAALNLFFTSGIEFYPIMISEDNSLLKQNGGYFLDNIPDDNMLILGSSELNTKMIASHPANLMKNGSGGLVPNIVGRGSCQAIVHASALAATKNLSGKKIAVLLSPQSYVSQGIMPDMYFANFSELQFCGILLSDELTGSVKDRFKRRMSEIADQYDGNIEKFRQYKMISDSKFIEALSMPYIWAKEKLLRVKDSYNSYMAYSEAAIAEKDNSPVNWQDEYDRMLELAENESDNNDFGFLNDYYSVNVNRKLSTFKDKDMDLSYEDSMEYDDLELLLDVCKLKGITPLIISVPLHGKWSDYTGFSAQERMKYYSKINSLVKQYDTLLCDLSGKEYEPYFLCDIMHLGWIGWLETNERISEFYYVD